MPTWQTIGINVTLETNVANNNNNNCGHPRTEDEVEQLQHWCGNPMRHEPKEENRLRKGKSESRYSKAF